MASSSVKKRYPPLLFAEGKAPSQLRSMNHNCYLSNLKMVEIGVGADVWDALKTSSVGVIAKLKEVDYTWCAGVVHYLLTHQLVIEKPYEIWTLIDSQPIRFSLHEFEEITGLNCAPFQDKENWDVDHKEFWAEMNVSTGNGPSLKELQAVLDRCKDWSFEKRRMVGWLSLLSIGIYGISPTSRIPLDKAKRVLDADVFESYPWGRVAFRSLIESIKVITYGVKKSYTMHGCVHVLLILAYETIEGLGERYGNERISPAVPLLYFILEDKKANDNKFRVRSFILKSQEDIYPKWDDDEPDEKLNNLIEDLLNNRLDTQAWEITEAPVSRKNKRKVYVRQSYTGVVEDNVVEKSTKKKKDKGKSVVSTNYKRFLSNLNVVFTMLSMFFMLSCLNLCSETAIVGLVDMVKTLVEKVDTMDNNLDNKVLSCLGLAFDAKLDAKVHAEVEVKLTSVYEKIASLENEVKDLKEQLKPREITAANSNVNLDDEVTSKAMSWMVQTKKPTHDDLPVQCVIRNMKNTCKKTDKLHQKKIVDKVEHNNIRVGKHALKVTKKEVKGDGVTATSETWSDPILRAKVKALGMGLEATVGHLKKLEEHTPPRKQTYTINLSLQKDFIKNRS
ncbi:hypothetical protein EUTSA_v10021997mg, partial [Eutrema salsugineum]